MLVHFSNVPIGHVYSEPQRSEADHKPRGLWVSDESTDEGWSWWCEQADFAGPWLYEYEVVLSPQAKIITLSSPSQLDNFSEHYSIDRMGGNPHRRGYALRWDKVAEEYDGILITPYHWERRLDLMWYYGWDCASGCIWNADAIRLLRPIQAKAEV